MCRPEGISTPAGDVVVRNSGVEDQVGFSRREFVRDCVVVQEDLLDRPNTGARYGNRTSNQHRNPVPKVRPLDIECEPIDDTHLLQSRHPIRHGRDREADDSSDVAPAAEWTTTVAGESRGRFRRRCARWTNSDRRRKDHEGACFDSKIWTPL